MTTVLDQKKPAIVAVTTDICLAALCGSMSSKDDVLLV